MQISSTEFSTFGTKLNQYYLIIIRQSNPFS